MKKSLLSLAVASALVAFTRKRAITNDISFQYRLPAGFPGMVNRTHPASIVPGLVNQANPPRLFGDAVLIDTATNSYRGIVAGDKSDSTPIAIDGIAARSYPSQQTSGGMASAIGTGVPALNQPLDVLSDGFIIVKCNVGTPTKGGAVFIWGSASSGGHVLGGFEAAASTGNTVGVTNAFFNGPPDANGVTEIRVTAARI